MIHAKVSLFRLATPIYTCGLERKNLQEPTDSGLFCDPIKPSNDTKNKKIPLTHFEKIQF